MTPESRDWLAGLRDFVAEDRSRRPLAAPGRSAPELAAERSIIGSHLATRLADLAPVFASRRDWCRTTRFRPSADEDPCLVITTSVAGMAAVDGLLESGNPVFVALAARMLAVTELEYRLWCIAHPDAGHRCHVNLWSWVKTSVPERRRPEFSRHPLAAGESYWLHRTGLSGAGEADRRDCHLWKWNGRHAALLEAFVRERAIGRLDDRQGRETAD